MQKMKANSLYKIPNGKLMKISLDYDKKSNKINKLKITGDFFVYPEEGIEIIENGMKKTIIDKDIIYNKIEKIISNNFIQLIGLNSEGITKGIMMCKK